METVHSTEVYADRLSVHRDEVRDRDGRTGHHTVVDSPDIALVVPVEGDRVHVVEQHRHAVGNSTWELPSGTIDASEEPAAAAVRELREETGLAGGALVPLRVLHVTRSTMNPRTRAVSPPLPSPVACCP